MITIAKRITETIPSSREEDEIFEPTKRFLKTAADFQLPKRPKVPQDGSRSPVTENDEGGGGGGLLVVELLVFIFKALLAALEAVLSLLLPPHEKQLFNQIVLVTGSGHGIGREMAVRFAAQGCVVVCWDKDEAGNRETLGILHSLGYRRVHAYTCDVSKRDEVLRAGRRVEEEVGEVVILVNNAGVMPCRPLLSQSHQEITRVVDVNLLAHFWTLEAFLPSMRKNNVGHIVAISSMCGVIGLPNAVPYSASKFAVRGLMEALYEEVRTSDPKCQIKFTTVYPFTVDTGLVKKPRNRFPSLMALLTPEEVASEVVRAVRQELRELSVPNSMLTADRIARLLPTKLVQQIKDFLDSGVEPED